MSILKLFDFTMKDVRSSSSQIPTNGHRQRYRQLMLRIHPDKLKSGNATELSQALTLSWRIINDYDMFLAYCANIKSKEMTHGSTRVNLSELHKAIREIMEIEGRRNEEDKENEPDSTKEMLKERPKGNTTGQRRPKVPEGLKQDIQEIIGHQIRRDRNKVKFLTIWCNTGKTGAWEEAERVIKFPKELKEYMEGLSKAAKESIVELKPEIEIAINM